MLYLRTRYNRTATGICLHFGFGAGRALSDKLNIPPYVHPPALTETRKVLHASVRFLFPTILAVLLSYGVLPAQEVRRVKSNRVIQFGQQQTGPAVVSAVALSADGQRLAAVGDDHLVWVWDRASGKLLYRLSGHTDWIRAVAFSPDGKTLASAGRDRVVRLWDMTTGKAAKVLAPHEQAITALAYSPDGRELAAAGFQDSLKIYDAKSGQRRHELDCPCVDIRSLAYSPSGKRLAAAGRNGKIRVWNVATAQPERDIQAHRRRVRSLAFSPDGKRLASAGEGRHIRVWDADTGWELLSIPCRPTQVLAMVFTGDDELAIGGSDNIIRRWNLGTKNVTYQLVGHTGSVAALACHRPSNLLVSGSFDTTVRLWNLKSTSPTRNDRSARQPLVPAVE